MLFNLGLEGGQILVKLGLNGNGEHEGARERHGTFSLALEKLKDSLELIEVFCGGLKL